MGTIHVHNAGGAGQNSRALRARLDADVLARQPDLVVLMAGTTDALDPDGLVEFDEFRANLADLCTRILAATRLLLLTIPPCHLDDLFAHADWRRFGAHGPLQRIVAVNRIVREQAAGLGAPLVDTHRIYAAVGNIGEAPNSFLRNRRNSGARDGVHPTAHGHRIIAAAVHDGIFRFRLAAASLVCFGDSITHGTHVAGAGTSEGETYPARLQRLLNGGRE